MKLIQIFSLILGLCLIYVNCFGLDIQDPSNEEGMGININQEIAGTQQIVIKEDLFWYNTLGSFSIFLILTGFGIYDYNSIIKGKELKLFGTHKNPKIQIKNYVQ